MMRQSSSRNQRYKGGFRLRHFLQICLLLVICIWLVYQVKHSHDKKKAFDERKGEEQPFSFRFGRKDLPSVKENDLMRETRNMDEDEIEVREDEVQEQEMKREDAQDEEGKGDADDWIDEQEEVFKNKEDNERLAEETDSIDSLEHEDSVSDARKENSKRDDLSRSVGHETDMTEAEAGNADARGLDEEKPDYMNADLKGNSSNVAVAVSNKIFNSSNNGDFNGFMSNISSIALGENITLSEAANYSMNGTSSEKIGSVFRVSKQKNGSISSPISSKENNLKELNINSTTLSLPVVTLAIPTANVSVSLMETANHSTVADSLSYRDILGNETASSIPVDQKHTIRNATSGENHSKLVDLAVEFENNPKSKTSEIQESEDQFATTSFSKNEVNLSHNIVTEEEREARTDLSTLPEIQNDIRHDYNETEE